MKFKTALLVTSALAMTASAASAGGIDRSRLPLSALFEEGRYLELGFSSVTPSVSGTTDVGAATGVATGNMAEKYSSLSFAYKADINDKLSYAVFVNQPYGADAFYQKGSWTSLEAHWKSQQIAALLKYDVTPNASVYGGLRYVKSSAEIAIPYSVLNGGLPAINYYNASTNSDGQLGYVIGAAYEMPDIALRVGLTYESEITHEFKTRESFTNILPSPPFPPLPNASLKSKTEITMPQSLTLDFQSGIAKDTLLFGSVKWSEWSVWHVNPDLFNTVTGTEVTGIDNDVLTYQLGLGRKLNDNLSVFARVTYEDAHGGVSSRLSPTDGMTSIGIGATYRKDHFKVTGGIEYANLGDAVVGDAAVLNSGSFSDNKAVGVGITFGYTF